MVHVMIVNAVDVETLSGLISYRQIGKMYRSLFFHPSENVIPESTSYGSVHYPQKLTTVLMYVVL
jgi:hypothetical protein